MSTTEAKKHAASDQKLEKQRDEGNVANVSEISGVIGTFLSLLLLLALAPQAYKRLAASFELPAQAYERPLNHAVNDVFPAVLGGLALAVAPIIVGASLGAILTSLLYNKGIVFAMKPILPKIDRISPVAGFKRMFGKRTWVELAATLVRLTLWFGASAAVIWSVFGGLLQMDRCAEFCAADIVLYVVIRLIVILLVLLLLTAAIEMIIQKRLFLHEQKMTDTEVKREQKDNFGSNEVRQERNRIRQEDAEAAESSGVDLANMCFYFGDHAIAIRYHPEHAKVPKLTAKAKTPEKSAALRQSILKNGFAELEHEAVVLAAISAPVGSVVPERAHGALVDAVKRMFSPT